LIDAVVAQRGTRQNDGLDGLEKILGEVVDEKMLSDAPLGCFLSGGVLAGVSTVVSLSSRHSCGITMA